MSDFAAGAGYLNTASVGIPPRQAVDELATVTDDWVHGRTQPPEYDAWIARARAAWGRLRGVGAADVAIGPQVSYFIGIVAESLPAGAEVVGFEQDFSSVLWPFLQRTDLTIRLVRHDAIADSIRASTDLIVISAVQSADGAVADLDAIEAAAAEHGALTVVDATQAGWMPLDATRFDVVVEGAYKWLLSPRGTTLMYVRPSLVERLSPTAAGWYCAEEPWRSIYGAPVKLAHGVRRFDMSPAWLAWVGTAPALEYLADLGVEKIRDHDVGLANRLTAGLGLPDADSAIVSIDAPGAERRVADAGFVASLRAGGCRVSFHLYNTDDDVDRLLEALGR